MAMVDAADARSSPDRDVSIRPSGWSPGTGSLLGAWLASAAIARLTGATAVILILAAALVVLQFEDLIAMTDPVNVPGTSHEHANWQRKVTADLEAAFSRDSVLRLFADMRRTRAS